MKTASDILMELLTLESKGIKTLTYKLDEAKTLAEAERKVLEHILIERGSYFNDPVCTAQEIKSLQEYATRFNKYINDLKRLREEMGL